MSRKTARQQVGVALFPFLAVLICTMGALIVLLVLLVQQARVDATTITATKIGAGDDRERRERLEDAQWKRDLLEKSRAEKTDELSQARARVAHLEEHTQRLEAQAKELLERARAIDEGKKLRAEDLAAARAEADRLKKEIDKKKKELDEGKKKAGDGQEWYALIPYDGRSGTRRRPIYVECTEFGVIVQPEGLVLRAEDFNGPLGPGNPLDSALRAIRDYWERTAGNKAAQPYPLLVVRPSGVIAFGAAKAAIRAWDDEWGYELISDDKQLDFGPPDPALDQVLTKTVAVARQKQAAMVAMMPRRFQDEEPLKSFTPEPSIRAAGASRYIGGTGVGPGNGIGSGGPGGAGRGGTGNGGAGNSGAGNGGAGNGNTGSGSAGYGGTGNGGLVGGGGAGNGYGGYGAAGGTRFPGGPAGVPPGAGSGAAGGGVGNGMPGNRIGANGVGGNGVGAGGFGAGGFGAGGAAGGSAGGNGGTNYGPGANGAPGNGSGNGGGGNGAYSMPDQLVASAGTGNAGGGGPGGGFGGGGSSGLGAGGSNGFGAGGQGGSGAGGQGRSSAGGSAGSGAGGVPSIVAGAGANDGSSQPLAFSNNMTAGGIGGSGGGRTDAFPYSQSSGGRSGASGGSGSGAGTSGQSGDGPALGAPSNQSFAGQTGGSGNSGTNANGGQAGGSSGASGSVFGGSSGGGSSMTGGSSAMGGGGQPGGSPFGGSSSMGGSQGGMGIPNLTFGQKPPASGSSGGSSGSGSPKSTARRGNNWALPQAKAHETGVTRPMRVSIEPDRVVLVPERGDDRRPQVVKIAPNLSIEDVNHVVSAVQNEVKGWGLAVKDGYWKPILQAEVAPGAEDHFANLQMALKGSGIEIVRK
jgi:hypothetical protein